MPNRAQHLVAGLLMALPGLAFAQAQVTAKATSKPDGDWHYALGAGASRTSGNASAVTAALAAQALRTTDDSKFQLSGNANYGRSNGQANAENVSLNGEYNRDFTPRWFSFGQADYLRDRLANLSSRSSLFSGVGRHVIKSGTSTWDLSAGLGYTYDRYITPTESHGEIRTSYGRAELLFAEESNHKLSTSTSLHQKLVIYPGLRSDGGYRSVFDSAVSVAMTPLLSLTVGLSYRYNSDPGQGLKKLDTLLVSGLSLRLD